MCTCMEPLKEYGIGFNSSGAWDFLRIIHLIQETAWYVHFTEESSCLHCKK